MSKIYFEALKKLPKRFVDDDTKIGVWDNGTVYAANRKYEPIKYSNGKWTKIILDAQAFTN